MFFEIYRFIFSMNNTSFLGEEGLKLVPTCSSLSPRAVSLSSIISYPINVSSALLLRVL